MVLEISFEMNLQIAHAILFFMISQRHTGTRKRGSRVLCVSQQQILLVLHRDPQTDSAYWLLPGGGRERGETLAACGVREVFEETGMHVRVERRLVVPSAARDQTFALFLASPVIHSNAVPQVNLRNERYLRDAAWHPVTPENPLGSLEPEWWGFLAPTITRLLQTKERHVLPTSVEY